MLDDVSILCVQVHDAASPLNQVSPEHCLEVGATGSKDETMSLEHFAALCVQFDVTEITVFSHLVHLRERGGRVFAAFVHVVGRVGAVLHSISPFFPVGSREVRKVYSWLHLLRVYRQTTRRLWPRENENCNRARAVDSCWPR